MSSFRERALRVLDTQPHWAAVMLADPFGTRLSDTRYRRGEPLPPVVERLSFDQAVRTRTPVVGNLAKSPTGIQFFPIRVPVLRNRELRYVLTAVVKPEQIRDVITRQGVPGDWVVSIFDATGQRVARSRAHEENLGGQASPTLRALMATGSREGFGLTYTLEGDRTYTPYRRMEPSGWSAALGIPATLVESAQYRSLAVYGGGIVLSVGLAGLAALWVARSINRPIAALRAAAQALGSRQPMTPPDTPIQEIREVATALLAAADERTRNEMYREELLRKEREARDTAETADRAKDQFLGVLSHELRTPLNAVYGWARMLRAGQLRDKEETTRALEAIERNANAQVQLVDDLLDVSRIVTGKMRLDVRVVDLTTVVGAALDAVRPAADAKSIRIQSVLDPRAGPITGDPDRLQQVVWNLVINAVKFTPKGGRVQISLQRINSHAEIVVSDTGEGIAPDILPVIFERFRQADSSITRAHAGLGLGLALAKHLTELHGGSITAQSAGPGKGATFVVKLPLRIAAIPDERTPRFHPTAPSIESIPAGLRLDGLQVLLVDDDPDALALGTAILSRAGGTIRTCSSASEALEILPTWRPDVLVSDIEMPEKDGYALIQEIRARDAEHGGTIPAVALTAHGRIQDRMLAISAGYNMHVPKPVDPAELTTIIASLAGRFPGARLP
jgi:signal transduction histidine kinase/ActR/RegA family two-component response regulator